MSAIPAELEKDTITPSTTISPKVPTTSSKRSISPSAYRKQCDICKTPKDVLVRCRIDDTQQWHFVCTGKCWTLVSSGKIDGPDMPFYQYGGMWKNKHAGVSAKKPKKNGKGNIREKDLARVWDPAEVQYSVNDKVRVDGTVWVCRRSHRSEENKQPGLGYRYWKEGVDAKSDKEVDSNYDEHGSKTTLE